MQARIIFIKIVFQYKSMTDELNLPEEGSTSSQGLTILNKYESQIRVCIAWIASDPTCPSGYKKYGWIPIKPGDHPIVLCGNLAGTHVAYVGLATDNSRTWDFTTISEADKQKNIYGLLPTTVNLHSVFGPECLDKQESYDAQFRLMHFASNISSDTVTLNKDNGGA
jgi:hypothetical protein